MTKVAPIMGILAVAALGSAQSEPQNHPVKFVYVFTGQSLTTLGSEDIRYGFGLGAGFAKPERRFRYKSLLAQLGYEAYVDRTTSRFRYAPHRSSWSAGALVTAKWFWPRNDRGWGMYGGLGWGLQVTEYRSRDLNTTINSTPTMDIGGIFEAGKREYTLGLRLLHVSNAGIKGPNQGQNQLYLVLGARF